NYKKDLWKYDPATDSRTQLNNHTAGFAERYGAVVFTLGGIAYVGTGFTNIGSTFRKDLWKYNTASDTWTQLNGFPAGFGGRFGAIAFTLGGVAYVGTGYGGSSKKDLSKFDPTTPYLLSVNSNGEGTWIDLPDNSVLEDTDGDTNIQVEESPDEDIIRFDVAGAQVMQIDNSGRLGIGRSPTTNLLEVEGEASKSSAGDWLANSDARLKTNIRPLNSEQTLQKLMTLRGITYEWADHQTGTKRPEGIQYGFTAQNIRQVFPELVKEDAQGYLQTAYGTYDAMYVEAIRALVEENKKLNSRTAVLEAENTELRLKNGNMEARLSKLELLIPATIGANN
ncbi:MAG: tail fiber domain-containing protein, partial [Saprospiraceae bacterium]|nr:tail fiber domain-containing protein [Saprospiraceae bacterium]